jgi:hypothetical protein
MPSLPSAQVRIPSAFIASRVEARSNLHWEAPWDSLSGGAEIVRTIGERPGKSLLEGEISHKHAMEAKRGRGGGFGIKLHFRLVVSLWPYDDCIRRCKIRNANALQDWT